MVPWLHDIDIADSNTATMIINLDFMHSFYITATYRSAPGTYTPTVTGTPPPYAFPMAGVLTPILLAIIQMVRHNQPSRLKR